MATSSIATRIGRVEPLVKSCFRNAFLHCPNPSTAAALSPSPHLVILFTWVGAKERSAYKFVDSWSRRGFNVLHVTTPVMDLVRPARGTEVTACRVMDFLSKNDQFNVILHGVSVGGYLGQRVLMGLQNETVILNRISHQIYDSFTQVMGFQSGVENAVHPRYKSIASAIVKFYLKRADLSCLHTVSDYIHTVPTPAPAFFMHSLADKIADYENIRHMLPKMARGSPVSTLLIPAKEEIGHVSLFRQMGEEPYMSAITRFLRKNKFSAHRPEVLLEENASLEVAQINIQRTKEVPPSNS